jgi:hypothetical protein
MATEVCLAWEKPLTRLFSFCKKQKIEYQTQILRVLDLCLVENLPMLRWAEPSPSEHLP